MLVDYHLTLNGEVSHALGTLPLIAARAVQCESEITRCPVHPSRRQGRVELHDTILDSSLVVSSGVGDAAVHQLQCDS